jgi:hypothetical protein
MSYAVPPSPPVKVRPAAVNTATILLWLVVATQIIGVVLSLLPNEELDRAIEDFNRDHPNFTEENQAVFAIGGIISVVFAAVFAIGLGVLAIFLRRGSQPARIVTWVLGGLLAFCQVCGLAGTAISPSLSSNTQDGASSDLEEFGKLVQEHTPAWLTAASLALSAIALLALIAAIILLSLPASNDFFRKEQEVWVPPTDFTGGGGYPPPPPPAIPQNPMSPPPPPPAPPQ